METPSAAPGAAAPPHIPVMLREVLSALAPGDGQLIIDGTLGAGGYTRAILDAADCRVTAFDRDSAAIGAAQAEGGLLAQFPGRLTLVNAPFSEMAEHVLGADSIVLDIGVSSMQIDNAARGFSFQSEGPLDMRMTNHGPTAADIVNTIDEEPLANILYDLGEEKRSRAIARAIVRDREATPFTSTLQLARLVSRVLGGRGDNGRHPATRTFQALRIYVNDELGELRAALEASERILKPGGRLVVVTFHSLEDRIVKQFMIERSGRAPQGSRHLPPTTEPAFEPSFQIVNQRALRPCQGELDANPRARSAKLRAAIRTPARAQL